MDPPTKPNPRGWQGGKSPKGYEKSPSSHPQSNFEDEPNPTGHFWTWTKSVSLSSPSGDIWKQITSSEFPKPICMTARDNPSLRSPPDWRRSYKYYWRLLRIVDAHTSRAKNPTRRNMIHKILLRRIWKSHSCQKDTFLTQTQSCRRGLKDEEATQEKTSLWDKGPYVTWSIHLSRRRRSLGVSLSFQQYLIGKQRATVQGGFKQGTLVTPSCK